MRTTHCEFGELVKAAFDLAARQTSDLAAQARIAAELIDRVLRRGEHKKLTALLSA